MGNNSEISSPLKEAPIKGEGKKGKGKNLKSPIGQPFQIKNRINHNKQPPLPGDIHFFGFDKKVSKIENGIKSPTLKEFSQKNT